MPSPPAPQHDGDEAAPLSVGDVFELGEPWEIVKFCDEPNVGLCVVENARGYRLSVPTAWLEHGRAAKRGQDALKADLAAARAEVGRLRELLGEVIDTRDDVMNAPSGSLKQAALQTFYATLSRARAALAAPDVRGKGKP